VIARKAVSRSVAPMRTGRITHIGSPESGRIGASDPAGMAGERRRAMRLLVFLRRAGRRVRRGLALLVVLAAGAAALPAVAAAIPPEHFPTEQIDETFIVPAAPEGPCPFAIEGRFTARLEHTHFFDQEGNEIRNLTRLIGAATTWTANGKSITDQVGGVEHVTLDPETGSATLTLTGLLGHLVVRGEGVAAQDSGRIVLFFEGPEDEEPDVLFERGNLGGGPFPALCEILAP
jgi:hypothetical protein